MEEPMKRDALVALIDRMMRAEARSEPPAPAEQSDWLYGHVGMSEADAHGWMAPAGAKVWTPRALCFWLLALQSGRKIDPALMEDPRHSLARWPSIKRAVRAYVTGSSETAAE